MNIPEALVALLEAPDWHETRRVLETNQRVLLSDQAIVFFRQKIDGLRFHPDNVEAVRGMEVHLHLLEDARAMGIEQAWKKFEDRRFQEMLQRFSSDSDLSSDPDLIRFFLFLYQQNPDELARQLGTTKDDPLFLRSIEYFRRRVGG